MVRWMNTENIFGIGLIASLLVFTLLFFFCFCFRLRKTKTSPSEFSVNSELPDQSKSKLDVSELFRQKNETVIQIESLEDEPKQDHGFVIGRSPIEKPFKNIVSDGVYISVEPEGWKHITVIRRTLLVHRTIFSKVDLPQMAEKRHIYLGLGQLTKSAALYISENRYPWSSRNTVFQRPDYFYRGSVNSGYARQIVISNCPVKAIQCIWSGSWEAYDLGAVYAVFDTNGHFPGNIYTNIEFKSQ